MMKFFRLFRLNAAMVVNTTFLRPIQSRLISSSIRSCKKKVIVGKPYRTEEELAEKFIDHKLMRVYGGKGGDGRSSFLREKHRPLGGPDGGNGGNGGDVIFIADNNIKSLEKVKSIYNAPDGVDGGGTNCFGRNGQSLYVQVPVGTYFCLEDGELLSDLKQHGDVYVAANGGLGGKGNRFFVTNTHTTPEECTPGEPGEASVIVAELRTLAHAGLVGFPNAGKSTLLRALSRARPQVADYQFTTLRPHVGILQYEDFTQVGDIPGIIEGAHDDFGLGLRFLRHIERCRFLIYVVDLSESDPWQQIMILRDELSKYKEPLLEKSAVYVANKIDLPSSLPSLDRLREQFISHFGNDEMLIAISGKRTTNLEDLVNCIRYLYDEDLKQQDPEDPVSLIW